MTRSTIPTARGVPRLSADNLAALRSMLEQQRAFRIEQLTHLHRPGEPGPLGSTDREVFASLATGARAALRDVQNALFRMDEGRYGLCAACGAPLDLERLEVLPQAALCMPCQRGTG